MSVGDFGRYLRIELEAIDEFRKAESRRLGRELSNNEAAAAWALTGAKQFREDYEAEERRLNNG